MLIASNDASAIHIIDCNCNGTTTTLQATTRIALPDELILPQSRTLNRLIWKSKISYRQEYRVTYKNRLGAFIEYSCLFMRFA